MHEPSVTAAYLKVLRAALRVAPGAADRIVAEVEDHLRQAMEEEMAAGMSPAEAERRAVDRFGPPEEVARSFPRAVPWARLFWLGLAISVALPAVIPEVLGPGHTSFYALALALSLGFGMGAAVPARPALAGAVPAAATVLAVLLYDLWLAWDAGQVFVPTAHQTTPYLLALLLNLPLATAVVLLGALGGLLGARARHRFAQTA